MGAADAALLRRLTEGPRLPPPHSGPDGGLGGLGGGAGGGEEPPRRALLREAAREMGRSLGVFADVARLLAEGGGAPTAAALLFDAVPPPCSPLQSSGSPLAVPLQHPCITLTLTLTLNLTLALTVTLPQVLRLALTGISERDPPALF